VCGKDGSRADSVFISSVSCWGNLGIIFLRERETLALSSMTTPRIGCSWWIGNIQELPASEKIEVTHDENEGSDGSSVLLILVVSFFLLNFLDLVVFLCCSVDFFSYFWNFFSVSCQWKTVVLAGLVVFLKGCSGWSNCFSLFSLVANWWWGKSCPRISLSMKDCGAAGRAAKSPLQILFWKTFEGFFLLQLANFSWWHSFCFSLFHFFLVASLLKDTG